MAILATNGSTRAEKEMVQLATPNPGFVGNRLLAAKDVSTCEGRLT